MCGRRNETFFPPKVKKGKKGEVRENEQDRDSTERVLGDTRPGLQIPVGKRQERITSQGCNLARHTGMTLIPFSTRRPPGVTGG